MATTVICKFCDRRCGNSAGLAAHVKSMHPDEWAAEVAAAEARDHGEAPPVTPVSNGLVWEEPPPKRRDSAYTAIVALVPELRRNPGRWARLYTWSTSSGANSAQAKLRKDENLTDIEFVARSTKSDARSTSALYGRYTGE